MTFANQPGSPGVPDPFRQRSRPLPGDLHEPVIPRNLVQFGQGSLELRKSPLSIAKILADPEINYIAAFASSVTARTRSIERSQKIRLA